MTAFAGDEEDGGSSPLGRGAKEALDGADRILSACAVKVEDFRFTVAAGPEISELSARHAGSRPPDFIAAALDGERRWGRALLRVGIDRQGPSGDDEILVR